MEIDSFFIHKIADFPPSAWAACTCLGRCTTGACAEDGEAPWKNTFTHKGAGPSILLGIILDIQIYIGRYKRNFYVEW